jgi:demethylmenaquinone methyltransferase/2-methoxy-6-polyprenyl-1,4-benzoquinol methylase
MPREEVLPVTGDIRAIYGRLSRFYGVVEGWFQKRLRGRGLALLAVREGETVLEVGFGTGHALTEIAGQVGEGGRLCGLDLTPQMIARARRRLARRRPTSRVELHEGDARRMPYEDGDFDAVYMAAALELFDNPDIPVVLSEIRRVLKADGRLVLSSMPKEGHEGSLVWRVYEWLHRTVPLVASCRPIYVEDSVKSAGFNIVTAEEMKIAGVFPMKVLLARPAA